MRLGLVARCDKTGLGIQTLNLARMLNPSKILLINSEPFNGNEQHPEWYSNYNVQHSNGFPRLRDCKDFLRDVDIVLTCEIPYNYGLFDMARQLNKRTFLQYNFEFLDYLVNDSLPKPTKFIAPSDWRINEVKDIGEVIHLPPPVFLGDFETAKYRNIHRTGKIRFLHIAGRPAIHDRNGTQSLISAVEKSKGDFELVIKSQVKLEESKDKRIVYDYSNPDNNVELYEDFDVMIIPRKYGGLCLPCNEALAAGIPVLMTGIEPNTSILPPEWQIPTFHKSTFKARTDINVYEPGQEFLIKMIEGWSKINREDLLLEKFKAFEIASTMFNSEVLVYKYNKVLYES